MYLNIHVNNITIVQSYLTAFVPANIGVGEAATTCSSVVRIRATLYANLNNLQRVVSFNISATNGGGTTPTISRSGLADCLKNENVIIL